MYSRETEKFVIAAIIWQCTQARRTHRIQQKKNMKKIAIEFFLIWINILNSIRKREYENRL